MSRLSRLAFALAVAAFVVAVPACGLELAGDLGNGPSLPTKDGAADGAIAEDAAPSDDAGSTEAAIEASAFCDEPGLLAHWRLDEGTGTKINDCTSGAHHGTLRGTSTWVTGKVGPSALDFDGTGAAGFSKPAAFELTGAMTVTAWVRVEDFSTVGRVLSKSGGPNARGWELNVEANGSAGFKVAVDSNNRYEAYAFVPALTWTHLAGVYEPSNAVRLYVNGVQLGVAAGPPAMQYNTAFDVTLGDRPETCCGWIGQLDDVRLYNRALTADEVLAIATK